MDVDWADTVNDVFEVGNSRAAIRPKRVTKRVYQSEEDMALAIGHYGQDAEGIVSPEAIRQNKYYNQCTQNVHQNELTIVGIRCKIKQK